MDITLWYAIFIAALAAAVCGLRIGFTSISWIYKHVRLVFFRDVLYASLMRRSRCFRATRGETILVALYTIVNGFCMGFGVRTLSDLLSRTGVMASINLIPLMLGGRTNMIAEILGISLHSYYLAHHWVGRVVILQSLIHIGLVIARGDAWTWSAFQISGISSASALALMLVLSLYFIRKAAYEIFLKLHFVLALGATIGLLNHLIPKGALRFIYPIIALAFWALNNAFRLVRIVYYNSGRRRTHSGGHVLIKQYRRAGAETVSAICLDVYGQRPFDLHGGQYFYLYFSGLGLRHRLQAHPFMASWWDDTKISFLIQPQNGLSWDLTTRVSIDTVLLDGPYGNTIPLENYSTVLLLAKGIGIAGILPHALSIIRRKWTSNQGTITRSVDLIWILEENCQEEWIKPWIECLKKEDPNRAILTVSCYSPVQLQTKTEPAKEPWYKYYYGMMPNIPRRIRDMNKSLERSLVAVCGDCVFTSAVRTVQRRAMSATSNVDFKELEFQPCQNKADKWDQNWDAVFQRQIVEVLAKPEEVPQPVQNLSSSRRIGGSNMRALASRRYEATRLNTIDEVEERVE